MASEEARGDVLLVLNPDALPDEGSLARWADRVRAHPEHWLLGGVVTDPEGTVDGFAARRRPRLGDILHEGLFLRRPPRFDATRLFAPDGPIFDIDVVSGAAMALRREALEKIGPMDEDYFLYHEDVEWSDRARARGGRVGLVPGVVIRHRQGTTTRRDERAPFAARMLSDFQYFVESRGYEARDVAWRWRIRTLFPLAPVRSGRSSGQSSVGDRARVRGR